MNLIVASAAGSSPLARGLQQDNLKGDIEKRIIPARAGFTGRSMKGRPETWDHPRSRGVYAISCAPVTRVAGSSPLARGLLVCFGCASCLAGIIPARAGFTYRCRRGHWYVQDHPRSRGVYSLIPCHAATMPGSSPLARGLPLIKREKLFPARIIPARAGFTWVDCAVGAAPGDHPRSRGVYDLPSDIGVPFPGSSPLARGLRVSQDGHGAVRGIIPARAGFTVSRTSTREHKQDHPRSRGVYGSHVRDLSQVPGSSPLARGLPSSAVKYSGVSRIIPARAGFTHPQNHGGHQEPDHPRSRGVYFPRLPYCSSYVGSSPLARGLRACHASRHHQYGIIPARAGFTLAASAYAFVGTDHPRSRGVYAR